jgi:hypothetical protein
MLCNEPHEIVRAGGLTLLGCPLITDEQLLINQSAFLRLTKKLRQNVCAFGDGPNGLVVDTDFFRPSYQEVVGQRAQELGFTERRSEATDEVSR